MTRLRWHRATIPLLAAALASALLAGCDREPEGRRGQELEQVDGDLEMEAPIEGDRELTADELEDWDADRDARIGRAEWDERFSILFDEFDADDDGTVDQNELRSGLLALYDQNSNRILDPVEFETNFVDRYDFETHYRTFEAWDADGDGQVTAEEFGRAWVASGLSADWDVDEDAAYSEDELREGLFGAWDRDRSGDIDETEWYVPDEQPTERQERRPGTGDEAMEPLERLKPRQPVVPQ